MHLQRWGTFVEHVTVADEHVLGAFKYERLETAKDAFRRIQQQEGRQGKTMPLYVSECVGWLVHDGLPNHWYWSLLDVTDGTLQLNCRQPLCHCERCEALGADSLRNNTTRLLTSNVAKSRQFESGASRANKHLGRQLGRTVPCRTLPSLRCGSAVF